MVSWSGTYTGGTHNMVNGDTVDGNVIFNGGATFTVSSGSTVTVTGNYSITVGQSASQASFESNGTSSNKAIYQSSSHDGTPRGDWVGFDFRESSDAQLTHLTVRDTTTGIHFQGNEISNMTGFISEDSFRCGLWDPATGAADQTLIGAAVTVPIIQNSREGIEIATIPANVVRLSTGRIRFEATVQHVGWIANHGLYTGAGAVWHGGIISNPRMLRWGIDLDWAESAVVSLIDELEFSRGDTTVPFSSTTFITIQGTEPGILLISQPKFTNATLQTAIAHQRDLDIVLSNAIDDIDLIIEGPEWDASASGLQFRWEMLNGPSLHSISFLNSTITRITQSGPPGFLGETFSRSDVPGVGPGGGGGGTFRGIGNTVTGKLFVNFQSDAGVRIIRDNHIKDGSLVVQSGSPSAIDLTIQNNLVNNQTVNSFSAFRVSSQAPGGSVLITGNRVIGAISTTGAVVSLASNKNTPFVFTDNHIEFLSVVGGIGVDYVGDESLNTDIRGNSIENIGAAGGIGLRFPFFGLLSIDFKGLVRTNIIKGFGDGIQLFSGITSAKGFAGTIFCCDLRANTNGIHVVGTRHNTTLSRFETNLLGNTGFGILVDSAQDDGGTFDATVSYWNSTDGPAGFGPGSGDAVSDYVDFDPFATSPCEQPSIIIGGIDVTENVTAIDIDLTVNSGSKASFGVEDLVQEFARASFGGKKVIIKIQGAIVFQGWAQKANPTATKVNARLFSITALNAVGEARVKKTGNIDDFNYTVPTDPASIFRDTIDLGLATAYPAENFTHDLTTIPNSTELIIADYRDRSILEVWNSLRDAVGARSFWIDADNVVYFREPVASANTLEEEDTYGMTNPFDIGDTYNRVTYVYDGGTKIILPKPTNIGSVVEFGFRDWIERDPSETDEDSARAKAESILARKDQVLQDISGWTELDFSTYELNEDITVNIPLMELAGVTKTVVGIRHSIKLLQAVAPISTFGRTTLTLGALPLRVSDILGSV